jgi:hypothetical protein
MPYVAPQDSVDVILLSFCALYMWSPAFNPAGRWPHRTRGTYASLLNGDMADDSIADVHLDLSILASKMWPCSKLRMSPASA